jgi:hypothetical protein
MSDHHIDDDQFALVAALDHDDPERVAADAHCARCDACRERVTAVRRALDRLDAFAPAALDNTELERARLAITSAIDFDRAPDRVTRGARPTELALLAAAIAAPFVAGVARAPAAAIVELATSLAALAWGLVAALALAQRRARRSFAALSIIAGSLVLAVSDAAPLGSASAAKCALFELAAAAAPTVIAAWLVARRRVEGVHIVSVAAASALAASLTLRVTCPDKHLSHLIVGHAGGVALAALFGAGLQQLAQLAPSTLRRA